MNVSRTPVNGRRGLSFVMVATGVFLATMDSSMINVALPSIMRYFSSSFADCQRVVLIYLLTITVSLLFWGHLSDRLGKVEIYLTGMLLFSAGSTGCGFSPSLAALVLFRFVQALGAAMMMSTGPAIITHVFPANRLGRALGLVGVATSCGLMCGPVVSGFLVHHYSWRAIFFVTIPLSFVIALLGWIFVRPNLFKSSSSRNIPFDWKSFSCWASLIIFLVLMSSNHSMLLGKAVLFYLLGAIMAASALVHFERKSTSPLLPVALLKQKYFTVAMVSTAVSFSVVFMVIILTPFYLTYILSFTPIEIGSVMMTLPVTLSLVSPISGRAYDSFGAKKLTTFGLFLCTVALFALSLLDDTSKSIDVMWRLALLGMGQSTFLSPNSASVLSRVKSEYAGVTSGILATSRNLGMLFGVSLATLVFGFLFQYLSGGVNLNGFELHDIPAFIRALHVSFLLATFLSFIGTLISSFR